MAKLELFIDDQKRLEREIEYIGSDEVVKTIGMILDYAKLHKGSKIGMLKGLQGLR